MVKEGESKGLSSGTCKNRTSPPHPRRVGSALRIWGTGARPAPWRMLNANEPSGFVQPGLVTRLLPSSGNLEADSTRAGCKKIEVGGGGRGEEGGREGPSKLMGGGGGGERRRRGGGEGLKG